MPRTASGLPKSRLHIELSQTTRDRLEKLRDETGADSMSEVIRRAIELLDQVTQARAKKEKLIEKDSTGEEREILFF